MDREIAELVEMCHYAAERPRFVQAGGGNCSVKAGTSMAVKASGYFLQDVTHQKGIALVDLKTGQTFGSGSEKPSLESPLHQLLGPYVIHTHPIAVGALVCAEQGRHGFETLFRGEGYLWIDYAAPGQKILDKVKESLPPGFNAASGEQVLFLQNHGLFVAAAGKEKCIAIHEKVVTALEQFFDAASLSGEALIPEGYYLSPDHAVYAGYAAVGAEEALSEKQRRDLAEIRQFAREVLLLIQGRGWTPQWLPGQEVQYVLNMGGEKYRQSRWRQQG